MKSLAEQVIESFKVLEDRKSRKIWVHFSNEDDAKSFYDDLRKRNTPNPSYFGKTMKDEYTTTLSGIYNTLQEIEKLASKYPSFTDAERSK